MTNLLQETLSVLKHYNLAPEDVQWCGSSDGRYFFTWEQFVSLADIEYDKSYGIQVIARDLVIVGTDWWLERGEYDGSEWWEHKTMPQPTADGLLPHRLSRSTPTSRWGTLERINK